MFCKLDCVISTFFSSIIVTKNDYVRQLAVSPPFSYDNVISRHLSLFDSSGLCARSREGVPHKSRASDRTTPEINRRKSCWLQNDISATSGGTWWHS